MTDKKPETLIDVLIAAAAESSVGDYLELHMDNMDKYACAVLTGLYSANPPEPNNFKANMDHVNHAFKVAAVAVRTRVMVKAKFMDFLKDGDEEPKDEGALSPAEREAQERAMEQGFEGTSDSERADFMGTSRPREQ